MLGVAGVKLLSLASSPEVSVLPDAGTIPESAGPEDRFESDEVSLPDAGADTEELPLELGVSELVSAVVPLDVSLALCASAGSKGMTTASVKMTKKTAQPVPARRK
jgi:hypothetical protein